MPLSNFENWGTSNYFLGALDHVRKINMTNILEETLVVRLLSGQHGALALLEVKSCGKNELEFLSKSPRMQG